MLVWKHLGAPLQPQPPPLALGAPGPWLALHGVSPEHQLFVNEGSACVGVREKVALELDQPGENGKGAQHGTETWTQLAKHR